MNKHYYTRITVKKTKRKEKKRYTNKNKNKNYFTVDIVHQKQNGFYLSILFLDSKGERTQWTSTLRKLA